VTHRFGLSDTKKAFEMLARGVDDKGALVLKIMVGPDEKKKPHIEYCFWIIQAVVLIPFGCFCSALHVDMWALFVMIILGI